MPHTFILTPPPTLPHQDAKVGDLLKQLASAQSSVDRLTVRASDCDTKVLLASSDAQKLHSQISAQEAVIKAKDTVIKTDEQKIQALTQQKKELEADMTAHRAATEAKLAAEAKHVADWKAKAEAEAKAAADWKARAEAFVSRSNTQAQGASAPPHKPQPLTLL
jgi:chromosome segregation ATPase